MQSRIVTPERALQRAPAVVERPTEHRAPLPMQREGPEADRIPLAGERGNFDMHRVVAGDLVPRLDSHQLLAAAADALPRLINLGAGRRRRNRGARLMT